MTPLPWRERSLAEPDVFLVVALSGRALASSVRRAGRRCVVADLFGDTDTRASADASLVVAGDFDDGFEVAALLAAAEQLAPAATPPRFGLVYSSGLESSSELLSRLAVGRRLYGNPSGTVARLKDPAQFFAALDRLGIPYPEISAQAPSDPATWLVKRIGGSGGSHVQQASAQDVAGQSNYFQRRISGRSIGASFLADGRKAFLLGFSEQWSAPKPGRESYRFGGIMQPALVDPTIARGVAAALDALVAEFGLIGLNSADLIVSDAGFYVLEINPRPGANLDIFDGSDPAGLFGLHLAACGGRLPARWNPPRRATAMSVLYADRPLLAPRQLKWPNWVADRPAPGARIEVDAPICTVLASASSAAAVREEIDRRRSHVFANLIDAGIEASEQTAAE